MPVIAVPAWQALAPWLVVVAIVAGLESVLRRASEAGADRHLVFDTAVVALLAGLFSGHALHVVLHGSAHAWDWFRFWGEQSVFGFLGGASAAAVVWLRRRQADVLAVADLAAPGLALAYAIARMGCFVNGDDFGVTTNGSWGVTYTAGTDAWGAHAAAGWIPPDAPQSLAVVPVQLLASALAVIAFLLLRRLRLPAGGTAAAAMILYGVARLLTEPLRHDFVPIMAGMALPQLLGLAAVAAGVVLLRRAMDGDQHAQPPQSSSRAHARAAT